jgi:hypothetical protein
VQLLPSLKRLLQVHLAHPVELPLLSKRHRPPDHLEGPLHHSKLLRDRLRLRIRRQFVRHLQSLLLDSKSPRVRTNNEKNVSRRLSHLILFHSCIAVRNQMKRVERGTMTRKTSFHDPIWPTSQHDNLMKMNRMCKMSQRACTIVHRLDQ